MSDVSYDSRAVVIDGRRTLILSGSMHYPRSTPAMWPDLMKRSVEAGLNTVETYVFWNLHERERGVYDFSDRLDLRRWCEIAAEHGLHVILRIGPYICSETDYGGFPAWLRDVSGLEMRTFNKPFMDEMARWVRTLCDHMKGLFAPEGGPIILAQIENEYELIGRKYGRAGKKYAQWAVDLGLSLDLGIPWIMCVGSAPGAVETINGFFAHEQIDAHFRKHPDQPALWTEHWPGWYDVWGRAHLVRPARSVAYGVARFFAAGGTGNNYYMWHGGTNLDRMTMYLQTTSYDFDAPLDEFGMPTTKSKHLARLHRILRDNATMLLESARPRPRKLGENQAAFVYRRGRRSLVFLANDARESADVSWGGRSHRLAPRSVTLLVDGRAAMDTSAVKTSSAVKRAMRATPVRLSDVSTWVEPMPAARSGGVTAKRPVEQLLLTRNRSDYCWYATTLAVSKRDAGEGVLELRDVADVVHVFVDGKLAATTPTPLPEQRDPASGGFTQRFTLKLRPGRHDLSLLCASLGLIKGDWQIGGRNMAEEKKGLWGSARWNGRKLGGAWTMTPGLAGECARLHAGGADAVTWRRVGRPLVKRPLLWYRAAFRRPKDAAPVALDLAGMTKGLAWVNGHLLGRYWLVGGVNDPLGWQQAADVAGICYDEPTQRFYHVPVDWLDEVNTLVLFEELGGDPRSVRVCERI
ncbi:MAG TPA: beta-galactosidase [Planctomycetota bacterium]|nr:beta-galactosidase [Planctomycetota bacterium]